MGGDGGNLNAGNAWIQIIPIGIELFYQSDFPGPIPLPQLLFAFDRVFDIVELLEVDEPVELVFLRETFYRLQVMLGYATNNIIGYTDVKRASDTTGWYVDVEAACPRPRPLDTGSPGQAGR
jgi:hypothetical protein